MRPQTHRAQSHGFTLIELLVVIAIIAILAAILFPVFAQARSKARQTTSLSNLKQQGLAMQMYAEDFDERYVPEWPQSACCGVIDWDHTFHPYLNPYIKNKDIWKSPAAGSSVYTSKKIYGTSDPIGYDPALDGGYSMSYLMNETGWGNGNVTANYLAGGVAQSVLTHPAEQIIIMEAAGIARSWNTYQIAIAVNDHNGPDPCCSTIPQPSDPNWTYTWKDFYNVPGSDWGKFGFPDVVPFRYANGNVCLFFDGHAKFLTTVKLKNVQPAEFDFDNVATNN